MKASAIVAALVIGGIGVSVGMNWKPDHALRHAAQNFSDGAEQCLLDVRDRYMTYEASSDCNNLRGLSLAYISLGGDRKGEPAEIALIAEQGRTMAWMARTISVSEYKVISLW